jgi:hypothetical protein
MFLKWDITVHTPWMDTTHKAVAGLLLAQTITPPSGSVAFAVQAFFAGLALKVVAEAAVDTQVKKTQS